MTRPDAIRRLGLASTADSADPVEMNTSPAPMLLGLSILIGGVGASADVTAGGTSSNPTKAFGQHQISVKGKQMRIGPMLYDDTKQQVVLLRVREKKYMVMDRAALETAATRLRQRNEQVRAKLVKANQQLSKGISSRMAAMSAQQRAQIEKMLERMPPEQAKKMRELLAGQPPPNMLAPLTQRKPPPKAAPTKRRTARRIGKQLRFKKQPCVTWSLAVDGVKTSEVCIAKPAVVGLSAVEWQTLKRGLRSTTAAMHHFKQVMLGVRAPGGSGQSPQSAVSMLLETTGGVPIARKAIARKTKAAKVAKTKRAPQGASTSNKVGWQVRDDFIDRAKRSDAYYRVPQGFERAEMFGGGRR